MILTLNNQWKGWESRERKRTHHLLHVELKTILQQLFEMCYYRLYKQLILCCYFQCCCLIFFNEPLFDTNMQVFNLLYIFTTLPILVSLGSTLPLRESCHIDEDMNNECGIVHYYLVHWLYFITFCRASYSMQWFCNRHVHGHPSRYRYDSTLFY